MRQTITALAVAAVLTPVAAAEAQRLPTRLERASLTTAIRARVASQSLDPATVKVPRIRVSTVADPLRRVWAFTGVTAPNAQPEAMVLVRLGGAWKVKVEGTADLGCGLPLVIRVDLDLECHGRVP